MQNPNKKQKEAKIQKLEKIIIIEKNQEHCSGGITGFRG